MVDKLGVRQQRMLDDMATHGEGSWPRGWRMTRAERTLMASLHKRGLVTDVGTDATPTEAGKKVAVDELEGKWDR